MSKFAILVGCYTREHNKRTKPPINLFFDRLFKSIKSCHEYRVIFSDDGSIPAVANEVRELTKKYPIEAYFRDHNVGECRNLFSMLPYLRETEYVFYISNDCFIRNLDNRDWLDLMKSILDTQNCIASTIQANYPTLGEYSWEEFDVYQKFGFVSTRHFMMRRGDFDKVKWSEIIKNMDHDPCRGGSWEAWFNNRLPHPIINLGYSDKRLGVWHIGIWEPYKLHLVCERDDAIPYNAI